MKIALLLVVALIAMGTSVFAGQGGDVPLLVENGSFVNGGTGWDDSGNIVYGPDYQRPDIAKDPWPWPDPGNKPTGYLRQIIDNSKSPDWNPNLNHKIETLTFDLYTQGTGYVKIGFAWWDTYWGDTKPIGNAPQWEVLSANYTSPDTWTTYEVTYDWLNKPGATWQPRWTAVEFYFWGCTNGNDAGVDSVSVTSRCVPEPSSILALAGGIMGLAGFARRKRF